jgi:hypothetical protein
VGALYHLRQIGGVGFGFGYVCLIAASVKWFPDKKRGDHRFSSYRIFKDG